MKQNRKDFLKTSGLIVAASAAASIPAASFAKNIIKNKGPKMKLRFKPYTLELKHVFTVAVYSRTTTPVMLTEIEYDGITGYLTFDDHNNPVKAVTVLKIENGKYIFDSKVK